MLMVIFALSLVIGIICWFLGEKLYQRCLAGVGTFITVFFSMMILVGVLVHAITRITAPIELEVKKQRYYELMYHVENECYAHECCDIESSKFYDQISEWNENIARGRALHDSLWFSFFFPDMYYQLEFIGLPKEKKQ